MSRFSQGAKWIKGVCYLCKGVCTPDNYYHYECAEKQFNENIAYRRNKRRVKKEWGK